MTALVEEREVGIRRQLLGGGGLGEGHVIGWKRKLVLAADHLTAFAFLPLRSIPLSPLYSSIESPPPPKMLSGTVCHSPVSMPSNAQK